MPRATRGGVASLEDAMRRTNAGGRLTVAAAIVAAGVLASPAWAAAPAVIAAQAAQVPPATPAEAAPFMGDWTLALKGPDRDATLDLTVKTESDKVVGEISAAEMQKEFIPESFMAEKTLKMRYSFNYQGNPIDAVISLTPGADGAVAAQIDFAGGAYIMSGTAAKKAAAAK
jgi:hypothetical protein